MKRLLIINIIAWCALSTITAQTLPYKNAALSARERAEDLCSRLTLEEKAQLMLDESPAIPRLGIKKFFWWSEALHGAANMGNVTVFPEPIAMASSFNPSLLFNVFDAASTEMRAQYNQRMLNGGEDQKFHSLSVWTPNVNIFRDPRWGRGQETYGEDPYLTSVMGTAVVRGLQGPNEKYRKLLACAKHFAVHSGPEWNRHEFNVENLPERDLWETYLPAFKVLVQEGNVAEIMCAYQLLDDEPCCGNARLLQQILLRDFLPRWHNTAKDGAQASAQAVLAGTDVECGSEYRHLPEAVKRGEIKESDIDRSLRRLLIARFELGDFDPDDINPWTKIPESVVACDKHKELAARMAQKSIVLLQNKNDVLPLGNNFKPESGSATDIVVMGPNANDSVMMWANYSGYPTHTITALEGIRTKASKHTPRARIRYIQGCGLTRNEVFESRFSQIMSPKGAQGIQITWWNNTQWKGNPASVLTTRQAVRLSNGGNTVFAPGVNLENCSARLEGILTPTTDETLTFDISGDDRLRLLVNGDTLVNIWNPRQRIQGAKKELTVKAGKSYRIQIDYVQEAGYGALNFDVTKRYTPSVKELLQQIGDTRTIVFVGGISPSLEGEEMRVDEPGFKGGDRTSIELPQVQRDLLAALHKAGKKVIFVNCSGSAMALAPELESCDAIIQWWYGGEMGGAALAEILFGDCAPSGKLPIMFYRSTSDLPDFMDYTMKNRTYRYFKGKELFPFGFGLTYTQFEIGVPTYADGRVQVKVSNVGSGNGTGAGVATETVQVYIRNLADKQGPLKTLRAYKQVELPPGESKTVSIPLPRTSFEGWDASTNTMRVVSGRYEVMVGNSSADRDLKKIVVDIK